MHDLPEQLDRGVQPGLGRDERACLERLHPSVGLLEGRCDLVVDLVVTGRVEASQVAGLGRRPVLEVGARVLGEPRLADFSRRSDVEGVKVVVQRGRQLTRGAGATVALHEVVAQKREDQAGVACAQQSPRGMPLAQRVDRLVLHARSLKRHRRQPGRIAASTSP